MFSHPEISHINQTAFIPFLTTSLNAIFTTPALGARDLQCIRSVIISKLKLLRLRLTVQNVKNKGCQVMFC